MLYYRKFGFEIGCFGKQCQYLLSMIPSFDMKDGYFVLVDESNRKQVLSDVKQLYGAWEVKYNGMIHNEGYEYAIAAPTPPPVTTAAPAIEPANNGLLLYQRMNVLVVTRIPFKT